MHNKESIVNTQDAKSDCGTTPSNKSENAKEVTGSLESMHIPRFEQLKSSGLVPEVKLNGNYTVDEQYFYACWYSGVHQTTILPMIQKLVSGSIDALETIIRTKIDTYCVLTTQDQYTIAAPLWATAFAHAIYGSKKESLDALLPEINIREKISVFCPLENSIKKAYIAQPLIETLMLTINPGTTEILSALLPKAQSTTIISWDEFSTTLNLTEHKSGLFISLLLEKMIDNDNTGVAQILLKNYPKLLKAHSDKYNANFLEVITKKNIKLLDGIDQTTESIAKEIAEEIVPNLKKSGKDTTSTKLTEEEQDKLKNWHQSVDQKINTGVAGWAYAALINLFTTPIAFVSAIALSGIGNPYMREILRNGGIPTGVIPTALVVLMTAGISAVLTERSQGLIDKETTVSFLVSALLTLLPGAPGGPRIQDSLGILERPKAITEAVTTLLMWSIVGSGMLLIVWLPQFSTICASLPANHLISYVTVGASVINALIIPPICKSVYNSFIPEDKRPTPKL